MGDAWRKQMRPGDVVLVVDVGGGTTDFSRDRRGRAGRLARTRRAWPWAITSCSAATTWTSRSLTSCARSSRPRASRSIAGRRRPGRTRAESPRSSCSSMRRSTAAPIAIASRGSTLLGGDPAHGAHARRGRRGRSSRLLPGGRRRRPPGDARARRRSPSSGCRTPPTRRSRGTSLRFWRGRRARSRSSRGSPAKAAARARLLHPTAILFNGGVMKAAGAARAHSRSAGRVARGRRRAAVRVLEGADLDLGGRARRLHLRARPPGQGACASGAGRRGRTTWASRAPCPRCPGSSRP